MQGGRPCLGQGAGRWCEASKARRKRWRQPMSPCGRAGHDGRQVQARPPVRRGQSGTGPGQRRLEPGGELRQGGGLCRPRGESYEKDLGLALRKEPMRVSEQGKDRFWFASENHPSESCVENGLEKAEGRGGKSRLENRVQKQEGDRAGRHARIPAQAFAGASTTMAAWTVVSSSWKTF